MMKKAISPKALKADSLSSPPKKKDEEETIHIYKNIFVPGAISAAGVNASSKTN